MKFACQVNSSFVNLPRLIIEAEYLHDAMNHYCEKLKLDRDEIDEIRPKRWDGAVLGRTPRNKRNMNEISLPYYLLKDPGLYDVHIN